MYGSAGGSRPKIQEYRSVREINWGKHIPIQLSIEKEEKNFLWCNKMEE